MENRVQMLVVENFGSCNMRCTYCFPEHMWQRQGHNGAMAEETYRAIVERTLATTCHDMVDIHIAGGEPLLAGRAWLEMAFGVGREIAACHGKSVTFSLQSNANFITPELARFLVENGVTVGVSLDGPPELNEAVRGNTVRTLEGFRILSEAQGRPPGVIVTVTRCNASRMRDVVDYLDSLGVALFRANQMGATASWNVHAAPRAEEWAQARQDLVAAIVERRGRIMEFNLAQAIPRFVRSVLNDLPPFDLVPGCCAMRCPAGRELMYFDQQGHAYACPRANVTAEARIGHVADQDFAQRWEGAIRGLDAAMVVPPMCAACPAQLICDYGCHAFNVAQGNFFEVNCDATKMYFQFLMAHLDDVARLFLLTSWRAQLKATGDYASLQVGVDPPPHLVGDLAGQLRQKLADRLARQDLVPAILERRYGWRDNLVPLTIPSRPRVGARRVRATATTASAEGGGN